MENIRKSQSILKNALVVNDVFQHVLSICLHILITQYKWFVILNIVFYVPSVIINVLQRPLYIHILKLHGRDFRTVLQSLKTHNLKFIDKTDIR